MDRRSVLLGAVVGIGIGIGIMMFMPLQKNDNQPKSPEHSTLVAQHYLKIDLGYKENVQKLKAITRPGFAKQFWKRATLEGSNEGWGNLQAIAEINQPAIPDDIGDSWLVWSFKNPEEYRYYKLSFFSGHDNGRFYSFSELALGDAEQDQILTSNCTFIPSSNLELHPPTALIDEDPNTFWHVKITKISPHSPQ